MYDFIHIPKKSDIQIQKYLEFVMKVEPITSEKDIRRLKKLLANQPKYLLLVTMGFNTGLRTGDLLNLKVWQVEDKNVGDRVVITEQKTNKMNVIIINKSIKTALDYYLSSTEHLPEDYLFKSRKFNNKPLTVYAVHHYMQNWCNQLGLKGNYGSYTLRKTYAYQARMKGIPIEIIQRRLNHTTPEVTLRYICIQNSEVENSLLNLNI